LARVARRVGAWAGLVTLVLAMLAPTLFWSERDSYPLSTFPMFASDRGPVSGLTNVAGIGAGGEVHRLSAAEVTGTDEVMLAVATVVRAVNEGRAEQLCASVAAGLDRPEVVAVEVRTERVNSVRWLQGDREPESVTVHARCEVP
jgi:hypothetical protein